MKLRLPLLLLSAVMATYVPVYAYSEAEPADGKITLGSDQQFTLTDAEKDIAITLDMAANEHAALAVGEGYVFLDGTLTGTGNLDKVGVGNLVLNNIQNFYFTGDFSIKEGKVEFKGGTNEAKEIKLCSGTVYVESGATLYFNASNVDYFLKNAYVFKGGSVLSLKEGTPIIEGKVTIDAVGEAVEFQYDSNKTVTLKGGLSGKGNLDLRANGTNWRPYDRRFILECSGEEFDGNINVKGEKCHMYLRLKNEKAAFNSVINLTGAGVDGSDVWSSYLEVDTASTEIKELNGNSYSQVKAMSTGNKLIIRNGGEFGGTFAGGVDVEVTGGVLSLGNDKGVTLSGSLSGAGSLKVSGQRYLTIQSDLTYTGNTIIENGATVSLISGGDISSSHLLQINGGLMILGNGKTQQFNGVELSTGGGDSILTVGEGSDFDAGTITGNGVLVISGTDAITGSLGDGSLLTNIVFGYNGKLYTAEEQEGKLVRSGNESVLNIGSIVYSPEAGETIVVNDVIPADKTKILQTGPGVVSLNADVSGYTGQYVVCGGGTLQFQSSSREVKGSSVLSNGSTLEFNVNSGDVTMSGIFSGDGNILKTGSGTVIFKDFSGAYASGDVDVQEGILKVQAANNSVLFGPQGSTGTIRIGQGAQLYLDSGSDLVINKNILLDNGRFYNNNCANMTLNGSITVIGNSSIEFNCDKQMVSNGSLVGDADSVLNIVDLALSTWSGERRLSLDAASDKFLGNINVAASVNNPVYLRLNHENAAVNAFINLKGYTAGAAKIATLKLAKENIKIAGLSGNVNSAVVLDGRSTGTLTIREGGKYEGSFAEGLALSVGQGHLYLGTAEGRTITNAIAGNGGIGVDVGNSLTYGGAGTYTGTTVLNRNARLALDMTTGSLSGSGALVLSDGSSLVVTGGSALVFNGVQLDEGAGATISVDSGLNLTLGEITSTGASLTGGLLISGTSSFTGSVAADGLGVITFYDGTSYFNARTGSGGDAGKIVKGEEFGELTATSNDPAKGFVFKNGADLTMTNGAGTLYTIGRLAVTGSGRTLTLGTGGLKINDSLVYSNTADQSMTINGGPLTVSTLKKSGEGALVINSALTASSVITSGTLTLGGGGTISSALAGSGIMNFNGTGQKSFAIQGDVSGYAGTFNIASGNTVTMTSDTGSGNIVLQGSGVFNAGGNDISLSLLVDKSIYTGAVNVTSGYVKLSGTTSIDPAPEPSFEPGNYQSPSALKIAKEAVLEIDQTMLTAEGSVKMKPVDVRTIRNLTGEGTLVLRTVGGGVSGNAPGSLGSYVYVGEEGFTGTIEVRKGTLSFRCGEFGDARIVLDGGAFSSGVVYDGSNREIDRTIGNEMVIGAGGAVLRMYKDETLTLTGKFSGSGQIQCVDGGYLNFAGDMSGFSGDVLLNRWQDADIGIKFSSDKTSLGVFQFQQGNVEFSGASTQMKGIVFSAAKPDNRFVFSSGKLILGGSGIVTTLDDYSMVFNNDVVLGAYENWSSAANVALDLSATSGISADTNGHDITIEGSLVLGEGAEHQNLVKSGAGTLTIKQDNLALAGNISIKGGVLDYAQSNLGGKQILFENGGILRLSRTQNLAIAVSGQGSIELLSGVGLNVQAGGGFKGGTTLDMKGGNTISFTDGATGSMGLASTKIAGTGNIFRFTEGFNVGLNGGALLMGEGASLEVLDYTATIDNYLSFDGITAWQKLDDITLNGGAAAMVDTRGHLIEYQENVVIGSLVKSGTTASGGGYNYQSNSQYYGALDEAIVDFSQPFTFSSGASTYGFTTQDDAASGMRAGSFTVSCQLTDDASTSRVVSVLGQAGAADRTVTLTNTANNFTGNVTVTNAVLKVDAAHPETIGNTAVTILGKGNTVFLLDNATLELATGEGDYVYGNNFTLNGSNARISQTEGEHTLSGTITVQGAGNRILDNTLADGALTLSGNLISRGDGTLVLKTKAAEESRIVLALNGNASLNRLEINGHVEQSKNGLSVANGMALGTNASYALYGGTLAVGGELNSSDGLEKIVTFGNGTSLTALGDGLAIGQNVQLAFAREQSSFTLDSGAGTMSFRGTLGTASADNQLIKRGEGTLELYHSITTPATIRVEQGTLSLKENMRLTADGDFSLLNGSVLHFEKGSALVVSSARTFTFNGSITGTGGDISGVDKLVFNDGTRYAATMSGQSWNAAFKSGSTFSGSLLKHAGDIVFDYGSHIVFDTSLPVSETSIGISTAGGNTVRFNGATVSGTTVTPEIDWDSTQSYVFTLVRSMKELLGYDGNTLNLDTLEQSVSVGGDGWGAFLQGELSLSEDSKELQVTVTRNGNSISSYAQTGNQLAVAGALDHAMNNFSSMGLRGTELGDIIQHFNRMGQNIAAEAPEALGMTGGLSNYHALAGQRTDMMRHVEAVRQRANAGKGLVGISNIPDNSFWAEGTQSYSRVDGVDHSAPGYTAQTWGGAIGVDYLSGPTYSLGIAFAYSNLKVDSDQYAGQTKSDNYYVDLYGRWESGNWNGVVVLSGGTADVDVKRTLNVGSDTYQGKGATDGTQIVGMAEVAYDWQWEEEGPVLQPYVGMTIGQSKLDGYTESGMGNASLVMDEQKQMVVQGSLGVRLYRQNIDREMQYETSRWELRAGLVEEFGDTDFVTRSSFIGLPGYTMSTTSDDIGRTGLQIGGGFSYALDQAWSVFGDVNGEFRNGQTSMNSTLGLRCTF